MVGEFRYKEEARALSYLKDAFSDLELAEVAQEEEIFEGCLFHSQQCVEKCMKSILALHGILITKDHRISDIFESEIKNFERFKDDFKTILPDLADLEWYYIPSRYSVSTRGEIYMREFSLEQSANAYKITFKFINLTRDFLEYKTGKDIPSGRKKLFEFVKREYGQYVRT
ncbi:MAG: HEPN domain-containing protein [Methanosarcinaceae archaeon]|nr:HEPN domain-containing protein [Methanosarcinaceae archaeon]